MKKNIACLIYYDELQDLYEELKDDGLEILDFPCNQFGAQAPGSDEEIYDFCSSRYGITFPQYSKIDVNGENAAPLYKWLTANTKKIAEAIASELGVEAKTTDSSLEEKVDILLLGSAMYAAGVDPAINEFIKNNASNIGKIVNFSTTAVATSTFKLVKKIADENNVQIMENEFHCKGKFSVMHKNRPNEKDLEAAKAFARTLTK